jgi:hypothetical protein
MTEPVLTLEIGGEVFSFMVDTGATISLIQPRISRAKSVTGTQLEVIGQQRIKFTLRSKNYFKTFVYTFIVSPSIRCSSGIHGMDFLQEVGARISLTDQLFYIGHYSFPLRGQEQGVPRAQRLINAELEGSLSLDKEKTGSESVGDWVGTVELTETVMVPPLSVRIARCRVVRRDSSTVVKVPRYQEIMVDAFVDLPGIYIARIVATLELMSSSNARDSPSFVVTKSPMLLPPRNEFVASCDGSAVALCNVEDGLTGAGIGECQAECPEGGLPVATTGHGVDLQAELDSHPVENVDGNQVDITQLNKTQRRQEQVENQNFNNTQNRRKICGKTQVLGYVPIHIVNQSLEEFEIEKYKEVGVASPLQVGNVQVFEERNVNTVQNGVDAVPGDFEKYAQEKLLHLETRDRLLLEPVLYQYKHLFYGIGNRKLGCTNLVEHEIETGEARPIERNPYRIPHALKSVVEEHINEILERKIIEPSISQWSSSIALVQKKSKDESTKYRFCVDYRALNAVTKPDAYPIPNIVDTLDSLGQSKIFSVLDMA